MSLELSYRCFKYFVIYFFTVTKNWSTLRYCFNKQVSREYCEVWFNFIKFFEERKTECRKIVTAHKKKLSWLDFDRSYTKWLSAISKIMFESMFIKVAEAISNLRHKGWWIPIVWTPIIYIGGLRFIEQIKN